MSGLALVVSIVGDARKLQSALGEADGAVQGFGKSMDLVGLAKAGILAGGVATVASALTSMAMAAGSDKRESEALALAIKNATGSTEDYTAATDAAIAAGQEKAFTDSQTRDALATLVTATGDVTAATTLLTTAQDVARFANVDLATAADAVAKAQAGQDTALTRMLPGLEKGATAQDTLANASRLAAGQADLFAKSTDGATARAADAFGELGETVGAALLPILEELVQALIPIIQALGKLVSAILPVLIPLVKLLAGALGLVANVAAFYEGPADRDRRQAWVDGAAAALQQGDEGAYVNFLGDERPERVRRAYPGSTWDRLVEVKRRYDPDNLFRRNHNIPPG